MRRFKKGLTVLLSVAMLAVTAGPIGVFASEGGGEEGSKGVIVEAVKSDVTYEAGEQKDLLVEITNKNSEAITNLTVKLTKVEKECVLKIEEAQKVQRVASLDAGKSTKVRFPFWAAEDAKTDIYDLTFEIAYDGGEVTEKVIRVQTTEKKIVTPEPTPKPDPAPNPEPNPAPNPAPEPEPLPDMSGGTGTRMLNNGSDGGTTPPASTSVPRVIVSGFSTDPGEVKAGTNFKLIIHIQNTSKKTAVSNMLFDLGAPTEGDADTAGPAFLPASGSSSVYLDGIPAGGTKDISIDLNARADLVQKPYSIQVSMKYEDKSGAQYEGASAVSIPVKQDARFEFSEIEINPASIAVGEEGNAMCSLYNLGRTKLYNVKAKFEGEDISAKEVFVGHVESGATASIDGMILGEKESAGEGKVKMIMTYEDESGNPYTSEKEFVLPVIADMGMDMPIEDVMMGESKKSPVLPFVIGGGIIVVAAAGIIIYKRKKKRAELKEEEGLIDEVDRLT